MYFKHGYGLFCEKQADVLRYSSKWYSWRLCYSQRKTAQLKSLFNKVAGRISLVVASEKRNDANLLIMGTY